jgi:hypothetical protein
MIGPASKTMSIASRMLTTRITTSITTVTSGIVVALLASSAYAAEPADQLSREATAAGPAVNTSTLPSSSAAESQAPTSSAATTTSAGTASERRPAAGGPQAVVRGSSDRLNLDTTVVTGNRELPKVLYIVPWKKSDLGELPAQPFNSLLDEALTPIDRDVFRREVTYYGAVSGAADAAAASAPQAEK